MTAKAEAMHRRSLLIAGAALLAAPAVVTTPGRLMRGSATKRLVHFLAMRPNGRTIQTENDKVPAWGLFEARHPAWGLFETRHRDVADGRTVIRVPGGIWLEPGREATMDVYDRYYLPRTMVRWPSTTPVFLEFQQLSPLPT